LIKSIVLPVIILFAILAVPLSAFAQLSEQEIVNANLGGPVFLEAFWTDRTTTPPAGTSLPKVEVSPGDGTSILAVTVVNRGFSDITSVRGILSLPPEFTSAATATSTNSNQAVATHNGIVTAGNTFTLFFQLNISDKASIKEYNPNLRIEYSRTLETGSPRTADITTSFKVTGKVILDASSEGGIAPGTSGKATIKISNTGTAPATGIVITVPASAGVNPTTQQASLVAVGQKSFEISNIAPGTTTTIEPILYASNSAGETLQTIPLQISYSNAYGEKKDTTAPIGLVILPKSSSSPLSASPIGNSSILTAGKITDLRILLANNGKQPLSEVVASIGSKSESIKILGKTSWNVGSLAPGSGQEVSTQVFASTDMIGKAANFVLTVQRISSGQPEVESFDIGTYVDGEISVRAYDIGVTYIGGIPNISGNLLNEGNVLALFTTVELTSANGLVNSLPPQQYLGDLAENSPLPFSIPISISNNTSAGVYPVEMKVEYKDSLRQQHTLDIKANVDFKPALPTDSSQQRPPISPVIIATVAGIIAVIIAAVLFIRTRKRSKLKRTLQFSKQNGNNGQDIESVLDSQLSSSSKTSGVSKKKDEKEER
jgi:hypothetical protein